MISQRSGSPSSSSKNHYDNETAGGLLLDTAHEAHIWTTTLDFVHKPLHLGVTLLENEDGSFAPCSARGRFIRPSSRLEKACLLLTTPACSHISAEWTAQASGPPLFPASPDLPRVLLDVRPPLPSANLTWAGALHWHAY